MITFKNGLVALGLSSLVLLGAGCADILGVNTNDNTQSPPVNNQPDTNTNGGMNTAEVACATGLTRFTSDTHNLTFCYPTSAGTNRAVTIKTALNGATIAIAGVDTRKVSVVTVAPTVDRKAEIVKYFATPTDRTITCEAKSLGKRGGREEYVIIGKKNAQETTDATKQCAESTRVKTLLDNKGQARFFFYDNEPVMLILSDEETASLGTLSTQFENSIQPKTEL